MLLGKQGLKTSGAQSIVTYSESSTIDNGVVWRIGDIGYLRWGTTDNDDVFYATLKEQTVEVVTVFLDEVQHYIWYVFGDESLNNAALELPEK